MKVTLIRNENATETWSVCKMEIWLEKLKTENKERYISQLRTAIPQLQSLGREFLYLNRIPRVYPVVEYKRTTDNSRKFKSYNGLVQIEVNQLSGMEEVAYVTPSMTVMDIHNEGLLCVSGDITIKEWENDGESLEF